MNPKSKALLENIKDQIISEVFHNEEVSLEEKINFCQQLENFGEGWRSLILTPKLEQQEKKDERTELIAKIKSMAEANRDQILTTINSEMGNKEKK